MFKHLLSIASEVLSNGIVISASIALLASLEWLFNPFFEKHRHLRKVSRTISFLMVALSIWLVHISWKEESQHESRLLKSENSQLKIEKENLALQKRILELRKELKEEKNIIKAFTASVHIKVSGDWLTSPRPFRTDVIPAPTQAISILRFESRSEKVSREFYMRLIKNYILLETEVGRRVELFADVEAEPGSVIFGSDVNRLKEFTKMAFFVPMITWVSENKRPLVIEMVEINITVNGVRKIALSRRPNNVIIPWPFPIPSHLRHFYDYAVDGISLTEKDWSGK